MSFTQEQREITKQNTFLPSLSLRQKGFAQVKGFSCSGTLLSPRWELEKGNNGFLRFLA